MRRTLPFGWFAQGTRALLVACQPTADAIAGPLYRRGAPWRSRLCAIDEPGEPLSISGTVTGSSDCGPISKATLDIWQTDARGLYSNLLGRDNPSEPGAFNLRGRTSCDDEGRYQFESIVPGRYPLFWPLTRPRHIHLIVSHPRYEALTTQIYFEGDKYNHLDPWWDAALTIPLEPYVDATSCRAGYRGRFHVVLRPAPAGTALRSGRGAFRRSAVAPRMALRLRRLLFWQEPRQPVTGRRNTAMLQDRAAVLTGLSVGVGLMYFLDPERGRRRRALVRDQVAHTARLTRAAAGATGRDVAHRTSGTVASVRGTLGGRPVDDPVLVKRVRARLGRVVSHPHAIEVFAANGLVTLRGPILQHEVKRLLKEVERVDGVRDVINELEEHKQPGNIPSLQGGSTPPEWQPDVLQRNWSPATRMIAGSGGLALVRYGASRRTLPGALLAAAGVGLLARAATNLETPRLTGIGASRRAVDIQKTITIDAPVDFVFGFWTAYENFPLFMSNVRDVRPSSREGQSHWTVAGPAGVPVEFEAEVSAFVPNEAFAWRTIEGSPIAHAGLVRFEPAGDGRTRVHIRMSYNPPGGWLGHRVAAAFGADPKRSLDADLVRMKTLIETGRPPHDAAQPGARSTVAP